MPTHPSSKPLRFPSVVLGTTLDPVTRQRHWVLTSRVGDVTYRLRILNDYLGAQDPHPPTPKYEFEFAYEVYDSDGADYGTRFYPAKELADLHALRAAMGDQRPGSPRSPREAALTQGDEVIFDHMKHVLGVLTAHVHLSSVHP